MVAVFTIGIIGFLLDRVMLTLQSAFTVRADAMSPSGAARRIEELRRHAEVLETSTSRSKRASSSR
jgi:hypothetical protein